MDLLSTPVLIVSLLTLTLASACVLLHYEGLSMLSERLTHARISQRPRVLVLIFAILALHSVEIFMFALGYFWLLHDPAYGSLQGPAPLGLVDCGYYSAVVFTTLGLGDIVPHGAMRVMTGPQSLTGFVLITWSASFTFLEMQRYWKRS
jgi:hypothetical protein